MYHVTFKGFENAAFEFSPVAFTVFGKPIYWYGIVITIGIILSAIYAFWRAKKLGIKTDDMYDYAIFVVIFGIIGARAYYVLTTLQTHQYKSFIDVIAVWEGGLAIYGGIIAGVLTILVVSLIKKIKFLRVLDAIAPSVMIGQAIGRWGNYFNQEAFGSNTSLPWGMRSYVVQATGSGNLQGTVEYLTKNKAEIESLGIQIDPNGFVHPTFLYECLWNVIGFVIINLLYKRRKFDGQMFLMYITWYGLGRAFIEMLRTDSLFIPGTKIRISMVVGFLCFVGGIILMIILGIRAKKDPDKINSCAYYGEKAEKIAAELAAAEAEKAAKAETTGDGEDPDEPDEKEEGETGDKEDPDGSEEEPEEEPDTPEDTEGEEEAEPEEIPEEKNGEDN
ncbi:MAG: prolipoprotein diacylglyceryl transferase [Clostridia bacterium]|nr:prolipoprotein diacylglyceryl transferase [Clostridia bacterium]